MKHLFFALAFLLVSSFAFANSNEISKNVYMIKSTKEGINNVKTNSKSASTKIIVYITSNKVSTLVCTIEGKVTITTEDGDCVTVEFKITADTCKEAMRVQSKIMEALE